MECRVARLRSSLACFVLCGLATSACAVSGENGATDSDNGTDTDLNEGTSESTDAVTSSSASSNASSEATTGNTSAGSAAATSAGSDATDAETGTTSDPTGTTQECNKPPPGPGLQTGLTLEINGVSRSYDLFVPTSYDGTQSVPLVLNFHGLTGTPSQQMRLSRFNEVAEARGMLVAYPQGIGNSFNSGLCCGTAFSTGVDDIAFSRAVVEHASTALCVDSNRVYATGMSNGGHMAHLLACEAADIFAATASVAGVLNLAPANCQPSRPISVMQFHGTSDGIVPYNGTGIGFPPVDDMMAAWGARNGCGPVPNLSFERGDMTCDTWAACDADVEVTLCSIAGGGHCWPGSGPCILGSNSNARDASEVIADMFEMQTLSP